jgi:hypothetical protein
VYADLFLRLPSTSARWRGPEFRAELTAWVTDVAAAPSSMEPVRDRPWSTVWRAETAHGVFYAKQNTPLQAFEASLMAVLAKIAPDHVVPVTAVDEGRDLLLTPDQGVVLGESADGLSDEAAADLAVRVVLAGAELQREVAPHADRLMGAGLTRLGPLDVVGYVEQRLDDFARLPASDPRALSPEAATRVSDFLPRLARDCEELASVGLPLTLQHNDLHQFNVFDVDGELRFFDFGDALLSDPLAALWVPLGGLAHRLECTVGDPRVQRVADAALECWTDAASLTELRRVLPAALQLGRLSRAESYVRCYASMNEAELAEYGDAAAYWLEAVATLEV